jgi:hypothetical protein
MSFSDKFEVPGGAAARLPSTRAIPQVLDSARGVLGAGGEAHYEELPGKEVVL